MVNTFTFTATIDTVKAFKIASVTAEGLYVMPGGQLFLMKPVGELAGFRLVDWVDAASWCERNGCIAEFEAWGQALH